ncbi:MAG TPA: hypothetical protein VI112_13000 [Bacteroidia bacterium]
MIRKILFISMWVTLVSGLIVTLGFAEKQESKLPCKAPRISISKDSDNDFIDEADIRDLMRSKGDSITGQPMGTVNVNRIERLLYTNPWVRKADVFLSIDGQLQVNVEVRVPLVRIINNSGESFYLDTEGKLMLWSPKYTPRVLVVSGNIPEQYNVWYTTSIADIKKSDTLSKTTSLDDIYTMAKFITRDPFWNSQVVQLKFNDAQNMELVPEVGNHTIIFGDTTDMKQKFEKLKIFYSEGLNHTNWNSYDTLNLKFNGQVVASKK